MWYYTNLTSEYAGRVILSFGFAQYWLAQQVVHPATYGDTLLVSLRCYAELAEVLSKGKGNPTKLGSF